MTNGERLNQTVDIISKHMADLYGGCFWPSSPDICDDGYCECLTKVREIATEILENVK